MTPTPFLRGLVALLCVGLLLWPSSLALGQGTCAIYRTYQTGDSFGASDVNSIQTVLGQTNMEASCVDGMGDSNAEFDDVLIPESFNTRTLSTQIYHDVANLRYVTRHVMGFSQWWRHYEDINFGHRAIRMHYGVVTDWNYMFQGRAHYWAGASTRLHMVSYSISDYGIGTAHPESLLFLLHVGGGAGSSATPSVRFQVGIGGDVHVGNTLMVHAAGTATHAAIFRAHSTGTGIYWPTIDHVAITSSGGTAGNVAVFHVGGIFINRSHVNGVTTPRNTLARGNLVKAWARISAGGSLLDGYGISSVTRSVVGTYGITWERPVANANYGVVCSAASTTTAHVCQASSLAAGSVEVRILTVEATPALADQALSVIMIGTE